MKDKWVLEYSASTGAFNIGTVRESLDANRKAFLNKPTDPNDWVPLFIGSMAACERLLASSESYAKSWGVEESWLQQVH